jgi:hypothetical protein
MGKGIALIQLIIKHQLHISYNKGAILKIILKKNYLVSLPVLLVHF